MKEYKYNRSDIKCGIVHIGVGNFHRAHQEFYTNLLLENSDQQSWGICGAMLLPFDEKLYRALKAQNGEYTLTVCAPDGTAEPYRIGSLVDLLWAVEDPEAVIERIASPETKIVTMTITECGYNIDRATGLFDLSNAEVVHDLANPHKPETAFGFVAEGLRRRMITDDPITILSCDNLQHNGNTARKAFCSFFAAQDKELAAWVERNVTFPNSMVDRITPSVKPEDIARLNAANKTNDLAPVYTEDFIQWVIEDNFIAGRPAWERVGVEFTDDVTAYENMKLSLLNASHMMLSFPASVAGYHKVDEAMADERFVKLLRTFQDDDMTYYVPAPRNTDLDAYKRRLLERFGNKTISDQLARICGDGVSKLMVYIVPNLAKMIRDGRDTTRMAFLVAAYYRYLKYGIDDLGCSILVDEPYLTDEDKKRIESDDALDFLHISLFATCNLTSDNRFAAKYLSLTESMAASGVLATLESIL